MVGGDEAGAVEVVVVGVDTEEVCREDDQALVGVVRAGERVRVVPAHGPGPEPHRPTLVGDLQIVPLVLDHLLRHLELALVLPLAQSLHLSSHLSSLLPRLLLRLTADGHGLY